MQPSIVVHSFLYKFQQPEKGSLAIHHFVRLFIPPPIEPQYCNDYVEGVWGVLLYLVNFE